MELKSFINSNKLAVISLIADIITISSVITIKSSNPFSTPLILGLFAIGVILYFSILQLYWEKYKDNKKYKKTFWSFFYEDIFLKANILFLSPLFILEILLIVFLSNLSVFAIGGYLLLSIILVYFYSIFNSYNISEDNEEISILLHYLTSKKVITHPSHLKKELLKKYTESDVNTLDYEYIFNEFAYENQQTIKYGMIKNKETNEFQHPNKVLVNVKKIDKKLYSIIK